MLNTNLIGTWFRRFLMEHLVSERNLSRNTQSSYRDTLALLLPFVAAKVKKSIDNLSVENISPDVVRLFSLYLEKDRNCSISTRNQRLAAIHALARFVGAHSPEYTAWCAVVCAIPFKKKPIPVMSYLEKSEMDALLDVPDRNCTQGLRDYAILLFLYNTGTRASEAANVTVADLNLNGSPSVKIHGKGNKIRLCPLWSLTAGIVGALVAGRASNEPVFLNRLKQPITRQGIYVLVKRYLFKASLQLSSLLTKKVSTHTIRHTTAVHLLRAGVDINTIRAWLGHVSLNTTNVYAEVDLDMKAKALAHCEILTTAATNKKNWHNNQKLMAFLKGM